MKTLSELRDWCAERWGVLSPSPAGMLRAWVALAPEHLSHLLEVSDLTLDEFIGILTRFPRESAGIDHAILFDSVRRAPTDAPTGLHLLDALYANLQHPLSRALNIAGFNWNALAGARYLGIPNVPLPSPDRTKETETVFDSQDFKETDYPRLDLQGFGTDMRVLARQGAFETLIPRQNETDRLTDVLMRRNKPHAMLVGDTGTGKTALVRLFAREVFSQPDHPLAECTVIEIVLTKLLASIRSSSDFEERLQFLTSVRARRTPIILVIDGFHRLHNAFASDGGAIDAGKWLEPFLDRDQVRLIGTTTPAGYHQYLSKNEELMGRFQELPLSPPEPRLVLDMVKQNAAALANYHRVEIPDDVLREAVRLTDEFQRNRPQPESSVVLLDGAAVLARRIRAQRVTDTHLQESLAQSLGRPVGTIVRGSERTKLAQLQKKLNASVVGQSAAIAKLVGTLIHRRLGLSSPERPQGVFLFVGPTGVGKTETARVLAEVLHGDRNHLIHLDLAEYSSPGSTDALIGTAPGYIRSDEDGVLTAALDRHPNAVVLLDEVEKAHPEVHRLFLGLLDNGRIRNNRGRMLDARGCIIILTSNALTQADLRRGSIGFVEQAPETDLIEHLADFFPREFLGRMDDILLFRRLETADLAAILGLRLQETERRLLERRAIRLIYDRDRLVAHLMARMDRSSSGARGVAQVLERVMLQPLALALVETHPDDRCVWFIGEDFYQQGAVTLSRDPHGECSLGRGAAMASSTSSDACVVK